MYYSDGESLPPCQFGRPVTGPQEMRNATAPEALEKIKRAVSLGLENNRLWNYCAVIGTTDAGLGWPQGFDY